MLLRASSAGPNDGRTPPGGGEDPGLVRRPRYSVATRGPKSTIEVNRRGAVGVVDSPDGPSGVLPPRHSHADECASAPAGEGPVVRDDGVSSVGRGRTQRTTGPARDPHAVFEHGGRLPEGPGGFQRVPVQTDEVSALARLDVFARVGHLEERDDFPRRTGAGIAGVVDARADAVTPAGSTHPSRPPTPSSPRRR